MIANEIVRTIIDNRKRKNATYSLRALARDSGIHLSLLSRILQKTRPLTFRQAQKLRANLRLNRDELAMLHEAFGKDFIAPAQKEPAKDRAGWAAPVKKTAHAKTPFREVTEVEFDLDWKELAILNLTLLKNFKSDVVSIAQRLNIRPTEASDAIERLLQKNLLFAEKGRYRKRHEKMLFTRERSMEHLRRFHRQMIAKAVDELARPEPERVERRLINGYTISADPTRVQEARKRIDAFQQELTDFLSDGDRTQLYQLNVQFFPLTQD